MQEVAVLVYCDVCFKENSQRVKAEYSEVVSIGSTTRRLELCDDHKAEIINRLTQVLPFGTKAEPRQTRGRGRPANVEPDAASALPNADDSNATVPCPRCGEPYKSRTNVMAHARDLHEPPLTMEEMRILAPGKELIECDQPGCGVVSIGKLGNTTHLRTKHGIDVKRERQLQSA